MTDLLILLKNAVIRGAAQSLFQDVNVEVRKGAHWAFTGENEALKTALLETLAGGPGLVKGKIAYPFFEACRAENATDHPVPSPQKSIQLVSFRHPFRSASNTTDFYYQQRFNASDSENAATVAEYVASLEACTQEPVWTFEKVIAALQLQRLLHKKLIMLSNGETKRVLLAAALVRNPVLLLLHQPLAGLDTAARNEIAGVLNNIALSGTTIIMTTEAHRIPEAITQVAVFNNDNTITTFPKKGFSALAASSAMPPIDEAELKALLDLQPMPLFNTIADMKEVCIRYGEALILDHINWTIRQGERWALTGPNGSGKSTLLSLINGDNPQAFANQIVLFDRRKGSGESIWDIKKKIGFFSPELYQYFPVDTLCLQAVESGFYDTIGLFRPSGAHTAGIALRWMKLLQIDHLAQKALRNVSPVQQRLCLLARALVKNAPLLLLDEPCQGFAAGEQARFKQLISTICERSATTLVYISHYADELPACITKTFRLQNGTQSVA